MGRHNVRSADMLLEGWREIVLSTLPNSGMAHIEEYFLEHSDRARTSSISMPACSLPGMPRTMCICPAWRGRCRRLAYVPVPTAAPDQSGVCGAVACPAPGVPFAWDGRVEHVVSGQVTHFHTLEELVAFISRVLAEVSNN